MSDTENQAKKSIKDLLEQLHSMQVDMLTFSMRMIALFSDTAVGTGTAPARKFRELLNKCRNDAIVYLKGLLPLSIMFVASISEYFEYYEALEYEEWCEILSDILEETIGYREMCQTLLQMHEGVMKSLKAMEDQVRVIVEEFSHLQRKSEKEVEELKDTAATKRTWAAAFAFVPLLNFLIVPVLLHAAHSDLLEATAKGYEAKVQEAAANTVSNTMIPAMMGILSGISKVAGFFSVMQQELKKFEGKAEKRMSDRKKLYYKVMKAQARDVKTLCRGFYAAIPQVRTHLLAIPTEGTDQNYIDRWLRKLRKTIQEKCSVRRLTSPLLCAITAPVESW